MVRNRKGVFKMDSINGKVIGEIKVTVCKTPDGNKFFKLQANTDDVLPVLYTLEDTLYLY